MLWAVAALLVAPMLLVLWHDLWLEPDLFALAEPGKLSLRIGSGDPLVSSEPVSEDSRFARRSLRDARGEHELPLQSRLEGGYRRFDAELDTPGGSVLALVTHPRRITMEPAKFQAYLVEEGLAQPGSAAPQAAITEEYCKHAKALVRVGDMQPDVWLQLMGLAAEVVPRGVRHLAGETAEFAVLWRGAAVAGFGLWYVRADGTRTRHQTDAHGIARVTLDQPGKAVLRGIMMFTRDQPDLQRASFWCSLCFDVEA